MLTNMVWKVLSMADTAAFPALFDAIRDAADVTVLPADQQEFARRIGEFDAYLCSLRVRVDRAALAGATRLKAIATPSTGLDHLDLAAAAERGIAVLSLKGDTEFLDSLTATAEMAWCLLLAAVRKLPWAFAAACDGVWARDAYRGSQLSGKTLGILGYGRLGRMVAGYGKAFRMRVLACDTAPVQPAAGVRLVDMGTLLEESDVLSIHVHLTEANRGLIGAAEFARLKPGAVLVNTSRGAIVDEAAMVAALESGRLAAAGLDVIDGEWNPNLRDHPLIRYARAHENLVISPHVGGVTLESQEAAYAHTVRKLRQFILQQPAQGR